MSKKEFGDTISKLALKAIQTPGAMTKTEIKILATFILDQYESK